MDIDQPGRNDQAGDIGDIRASLVEVPANRDDLTLIDQNVANRVEATTGINDEAPSQQLAPVAHAVTSNRDRWTKKERP
jgi:hypothetical protein